MAWNTKFKQASAARKREAALRPLPVSPEVKQEARATDPRPVLERYGYEVRSVGKQYSVRKGGDEVYRSTFKYDHWVHCDHYGNGVGDNISLVREIDPGKSFVDAAFELHRGASFQPVPDYSHMRPSMPPCNDKAQERGRQYLMTRGISDKTIKKAEDAGFTTYTLDGVLTLGRAGGRAKGEIRSITHRAWDKKAKVQKRDLRHSDKVGSPPILHGDPARVVVVEGGIDALAAHDICHRQGREAPTVIVSSSAEAMGFLEQPHVQEILKSATQVTIAFENDPEQATKAKTDGAHKKQMVRIMEIVPAVTTVQPYHPPKGCKDIADANFALANNELNARKGSQKKEIGSIKCYQNKLFQQKYRIPYRSVSLARLYIDLNPSEPGIQACVFGTGVELIDRGDVLSCYGSDLPQQAEIAIEIAIAKGWDLTNLEIEGSPAWIEAVFHAAQKKIEFADDADDADDASSVVEAEPNF